MKILCLPGAYGSEEKFQVQLAPIIKELTDDGTATFHCVNGPCKAKPPKGFEEYFGQPPYFRWIEPDFIAELGLDPDEILETGDEDILQRIRDFPECDTPEDTMRELTKYGTASAAKSTDRAIEYLLEVMEKEGPFQGLIGYSEGATVAATLLLFEQRRYEREGIEPMLKYALFFAGWPPVDPDSHQLVVADETEEVIEVPTCHVIGSLDPYLHGSLALYNVCNPETAHLFDHAKGHTLPRDKETVKELGDVIRDAIKKYDIRE